MKNKAIQFVLPPTVEKIVETVSTNRNVRPPNLLIPLDSGNGRSSLVSALTEGYEKSRAIEFSSRDHFMEFKLSGTVGNINDTYAEIRENAEYANHFRGIVAFEVDTLLTKLTDTIGDKFFEMILNVKRHAVVILFIPADCSKKSVDLILDKGGKSFIHIPPVIHSDLVYATAFRRWLSRSVSEIAADQIPTETIVSYLKKSLTHMTMKNVHELADSMAFEYSAKLKQIFAKEEAVAVKGDIR